MTITEGKSRKIRLAETILRLAGALAAGGINALVMSYWTGEMRKDLVSFFVTLNAATTAVSCVIGYYFTGWITTDSRWRVGARTGALAGALVGGMNGTCVFPLAGTLVGAVIGAVSGLVCGLLMATVAQSLALGFDGGK